MSEIISTSDIEILILKEQACINALTTLKERIKKVNKDCAISKTVGSSVAIASSISTVAGIFLAPLTAGLSLGLTAGGIAGGIAGGGTVLGTNIAECVKSREWADELQATVAPLEEELKRIGLKITNHPAWLDIIKNAGSGAKYVYTASKSSIELAKTFKFLAIAAPQYGLQTSASFLFAYKNIPGQFLIKAHNILRTTLGKMGVAVGKIGLTTIRFLATGLNVVGAGLDIYTIVDAWTSTPESVTQIEKIISELMESSTKLRQLTLESDSELLIKGYYWKPSGGETEGKGIDVGFDGGYPVFVIRAYYEGGVIPGKLHNGQAYISFDGREIQVSQYEVRTI